MKIFAAFIHQRMPLGLVASVRYLVEIESIGCYKQLMSKTLVAQALAERVSDGDVLGLGSGSTAELAVKMIGERITKEGIRVSGVPTSHEVALLAHEKGITVLSSLTSVELTWAFDGADEIDPAFRLIKGRGAAMLNEKIIAERARGKLVIIATDDKFVDKLGSKFPVPIEVIPEAIGIVKEGLRKLGAVSVETRSSDAKYGPTISEHNNLVLDVRFDGISNELPSQIKNLTGVVDHGLFLNLTNEVIVSRADGVWSKRLVGGKILDEPIGR